MSAVKKGGDKAYQYAREDMDRRRELHAQRAEERKRHPRGAEGAGRQSGCHRLTAYDESEEEDYDEEAFDREFGADLEALEECRMRIAMDRGAGPDSRRIWTACRRSMSFRGKFDPPLEPGAGEDAS